MERRIDDLKVIMACPAIAKLPLQKMCAWARRLW
jgi:hypothetical protein